MSTRAHLLALGVRNPALTNTRGGGNILMSGFLILSFSKARRIERKRRFRISIGLVILIELATLIDTLVTVTHQRLLLRIISRGITTLKRIQIQKL
jgi:hypothetical protein